MSLTIEALNREVKFKTSRSSGAGGQNVNKVETKVTLYWAMEDSALLTEEQKEKLAIKLSSRTNAEGQISPSKNYFISSPITSCRQSSERQHEYPEL